MFVLMERRSFGNMTEKKKQQRVIRGSHLSTNALNVRDVPIKTKCIKGNNSRIPIEERVKRLYVSKTMKEKKKGRSGTDYQRVWDTAEDEPEYPGRRLVCGCKSRHGIPAVHIPGHRQCDCPECGPGDRP